MSGIRGKEPTVSILLRGVAEIPQGEVDDAAGLRDKLVVGKRLAICHSIGCGYMLGIQPGRPQL